MANQEPMRITVRDALLINRNFEGRKTDYNDEGSQNFCVVLDFETAAKLKADGWNVKYDPRIERGEPIEEGDERHPFLPVQLGYKIRPPRVVMITPKGNKISLGQHDVSVLDWADIMKADIVINSSYWERVGKSGIKAYVKTLVVWIDEDELESEHGLNDMFGVHGNDEVYDTDGGEIVD